MTNKNSSIINVTVNGMKATEGVKHVQSRLESAERSIFNIALISAYSTGVTIPAYTDNKGNNHAEAICEKPFKQVDFIKLVGRSKPTLSRWIKAMKLIIDKGYFNDFASGLYPFSYDKIIEIFGNEEAFSGRILADLMKMSADTLEIMASDYQSSIAKGKTEERTEEETEVKEETKERAEKEVPTAEEETAILIYNGNNYIVNKAVFEKWLAENGKFA